MHALFIMNGLKRTQTGPQMVHFLKSGRKLTKLFIIITVIFLLWTPTFGWFLIRQCIFYAKTFWKFELSIMFVGLVLVQRLLLTDMPLLQKKCFRVSFMTNSYPVAREHGRTRTAAESFLFQKQLVQFWVSMDFLK